MKLLNNCGFLEIIDLHSGIVILVQRKSMLLILSIPSSPGNSQKWERVRLVFFSIRISPKQQYIQKEDAKECPDIAFNEFTVNLETGSASRGLFPLVIWCHPILPHTTSTDRLNARDIVLFAHFNLRVSPKHQYVWQLHDVQCSTRASDRGALAI